MSRSERQACADLNRRRASAIKEIAREYAPSESVPPDVWVASFARRFEALEVPLVDLAVLGFSDDNAECMHSLFLGNLGWGREATAWVDRASNCVYKLFDLRDNGSLGFQA